MHKFEIGEIVRTPKGQDLPITARRLGNGLPEYQVQGMQPEEWLSGADLTALNEDGTPVVEMLAVEADIRSAAYRALIELYSYHGSDTRFSARLDLVRTYIEALEPHATYMVGMSTPAAVTLEVAGGVVIDESGQPVDVPAGDLAADIQAPATIEPEPPAEPPASDEPPASKPVTKRTK